MLSKRENKFHEAVSICIRNPKVIDHLRYPQKMRKSVEKVNYVTPNKLHTNIFGPSDPKKFWSFADFGLTQKEVFFVHEGHPNL